MIGYFAPSYKRPKGTTTQGNYPFVKYVVAEFEAEDYLKEGLDCWIVPDSAQGNLCRVRNYILDNADTDKIVMVDDDMTGLARWENQKPNRLNPGEFQEFCEMGFQVADDLKIKYWGVNLLSDKGAYREYTPFSFKSYIGGPFQAFNSLDLRYDEKLPLKEDYDLSLQVLNKYRKTLRFNAYHYLVKQHTNVGGCADYRTIQYEKEQMAALVRKWGSKIVKQDFSAKGYDINPIIKVPIGGV